MRKQTMIAVVGSLLVAFAVACSSPASMSVAIAADERAVVTVTGSEMNVRLENEGPGGIQIHWDCDDDAFDANNELDGVGHVSFPFPKSVRVTVWPLRAEETRIVVTAEGATSVGAEVSALGPEDMGNF